MPSGAMSPCPPDHPLMIAWKAYEQGEDYENSKRWALTIWPMLQVGDPEAERKRLSLAPIEQREQWVKGSMWAAFMAGFAAAGGKTSV